MINNTQILWLTEIKIAFYQADLEYLDQLLEKN